MAESYDPIQLGILIVAALGLIFSILSAVVAIVWAVANIKTQTAKIENKLQSVGELITKLGTTIEVIEKRQEEQEIRLTVLEKTSLPKVKPKEGDHL